MFDEAHAHIEVRDAFQRNVAVPPIDLTEIRRRIAAPVARPAAGPMYARFAAAAAAVVAAVVLTARAPAVMQTMEQRYRDILIASGIVTAPPMSAVPLPIRNAIKPAQVTLAQAQQRVDFRIAAPSGLPRDVVRRTITVAPVAAWSPQTNAWSAADWHVTFTYLRADGRTFTLSANRYSAANAPWPAYVYQVAPRGKPRVTGDENFAWRNGDQVLQIAATSAIGGGEIESIRRAMSGIPLPLDTGGSKRVFQYTIKDP